MGDQPVEQQGQELSDRDTTILIKLETGHTNKVLARFWRINKKNNLSATMNREGSGEARGGENQEEEN